jgi:hypothetical protein
MVIFEIGRFDEGEVVREIVVRRQCIAIRSRIEIKSATRLILENELLFDFSNESR